MNNEIKIEKNIPIPPGRNKSELGKAIRLLKVGESFLAPANTVHGTISTHARRVNIKYTTRVEYPEGKDNIPRIRVWRTE